MITEQQIEAAKKNARLHGFNQEVSDDLARQFVKWHLGNSPTLTSVFDAIKVGLSDSTENQIQWWGQRLNG